MSKRLDNLYFRNITAQKCCPYHQVKNYNSCSEEQVAKTEAPSRADYKKPKESFENYYARPIYSTLKNTCGI